MPWFEISVVFAATLGSLYPQRFLAIVGAAVPPARDEGANR